MWSLLLASPLARLFVLYVGALLLVVLFSGKGEQGPRRRPPDRPPPRPRGGLSPQALRGVRALCAKDYAARFARAAARIRAF
jgi:hypothetical protein